MNVIESIVIFCIWSVAVVVFFLLLNNFLTKGHFFAYMQVKTGRGKKVLARIHSATDTYYRPAEWSDGVLNIKTRSGEKLTLPIGASEFKGFLKRTLGVSEIEIDEEAKTIVDVNLDSYRLMEVDPARLNSIILKIKNRPREMSNKELIIIFLMLGVLGGIIFVGYQSVETHKLLENVLQLSGVIR